MTEVERGTDRAGRRAKRFLSRPGSTRSGCSWSVRRWATAEHVDRSTIMRIRTVAKEGALAALAASKPGVHGHERDYKLELAKAEVARLSEALKEMAVKRTLVEGKGRWG
jgi:transposase